MSGRLCGLVFDNGPTERDQRFVLLAIAERATEKGFCYPSIQEIALRTLFTREYVGRTVKRLVADGWVTLGEHPRNHRSNSFQINIEKMKKCEPSSRELSSREESSCELQQGSHVNSVPSSCELVTKPPITPLKVEPSGTVIEPSGGEEKPQNAFVELPVIGGKVYPVYASMLPELQELYPAVDVPQELRKMRGWLIADVKRRKTLRGCQKFIHGWLGRSQDRGYSRSPVNEIKPTIQLPKRPVLQ